MSLSATFPANLATAGMPAHHIHGPESLLRLVSGIVGRIYTVLFNGQRMGLFKNCLSHPARKKNGCIAGLAHLSVLGAAPLLYLDAGFQSSAICANTSQPDKNSCASGLS
jgi:hypothetical protein